MFAPERRWNEATHMNNLKKEIIMTEERKYELIFGRGWAQVVRDKFGIDQARLLRIARSCGVGLSPENVAIYRYLWENRQMLLRQGYLKTFEKNDKMYKSQNV